MGKSHLCLINKPMSWCIFPTFFPEEFREANIVKGNYLAFPKTNSGTTKT